MSWLFCFYVLVGLLGAQAADEDAAKISVLKSVQFEKSSVYINTPNDVHHMEVDLYRNDGGILYADDSSLKTTSKSENQVATGFSHITGFTQINSTLVVAVDANAHCIKTIDRQTRLLKTFAGQCGSNGYEDGMPGKFNEPWGVVMDKRNGRKILVSDNDNHAIRSVEIDSGAISTVIKTGLTQPFGMTWYGDRLLVVSMYFISEIQWSDTGIVTNTLIAGSTSYGYVDGEFRTSRFNEPYDIYPLSASLYLVADLYNNALRVLNMISRQVLPVCFDTQQCTTSTRGFDGPSSVLKTTDSVYVGAKKSIKRLSGGDIFTIISTNPLATNGRAKVCVPKNITVTLKGNVEGKWKSLNPGYYEYVETANGCTVGLNVVDGNLRRKLVFQADYDVTCEQATSSVAKNIVLSTAKPHFKWIKQFCDNYCNSGASSQPVIGCSGGKLRIQWPTDKIYHADANPTNTLQALSKNVGKAGTQPGFNIVVVSRNPPVVYPVKNSSGLSVTATLVSYCENGATHNKNSDLCE